VPLPPCHTELESLRRLQRRYVGHSAPILVRARLHHSVGHVLQASCPINGTIFTVEEANFFLGCVSLPSHVLDHFHY